MTTAGGESIRIVAETRGARSDFSLERRLTDGSLDTRFGARGRMPFNLGRDSDPPASLRGDELGRILVVGTTRIAGGGFRAIVLRLLPNGAPDFAWGDAGRSVVSPREGNAAALDVLALPDGRLLVVGLVDVGGEQAAAWHLAPDGRVDASTARSARLMLSGYASSRGVSLARVDPHQIVLGLRVQDGDDMMLEAHALDPTQADALPQRISRQLWPPAWADAPVWSRVGAGWQWKDPADPNSPPVAAERTGASASSPWVSLSAIAVMASTAVPPEPGGAVFSPFQARAAAPVPDEGVDTLWIVAGVAAVLIAGTLVALRLRRRPPARP